MFNQNISVIVNFFVYPQVSFVNNVKYLLVMGIGLKFIFAGTRKLYYIYIKYTTSLGA